MNTHSLKSECVCDDDVCVEYHHPKDKNIRIYIERGAMWARKKGQCVTRLYTDRILYNTEHKHTIH
jgi:hypothetical protein